MRLRNGVLLVLAAIASPVSAQQVPARADSTLRGGYNSLDELLAALPAATPPALDESRALWLGSLALGCLDRLQAMPGRRGGANPGGRASGAPQDSAGQREGARAGTPQRGTTTATRGTTTPPRAGGTRGATGQTAAGGATTRLPYFWIPTYTLVANHNRTRAFWGCADWHSAVSSTWAAVRVLRSFPEFGLKELAREKLNAHLAKSNLDGELAFFSGPAGQFERPYGYAWLLKLQSELHTWTDSQATRWSSNVRPLARWMSDSLASYFVSLPRPVRTGGQTNTAFIANLALDYADAAQDDSLRTLLMNSARKFFAEDKDCRTESEAVALGTASRGGGAGDSTAGRRGGARGGDAGARGDRGGGGGEGRRGGRGGAGAGATASANDILSSCLAEAALMARVLESTAFLSWLNAFLPPLESARFAPLARAPLARAPGDSVTATERARRSALSFQRAYAMERIARALPESDPRVVAWRRIAALHADRGFQLMRDDIIATHWLPAFALLYLTGRSGG